MQDANPFPFRAMRLSLLEQHMRASFDRTIAKEPEQENQIEDIDPLGSFISRKRRVSILYSDEPKAPNSSLPTPSTSPTRAQELTDNGTKFSLVHQPHPFQRKCYDGENRHLKPTPLTVTKNGPGEIQSGTISVELCNEIGEPVNEKEAFISCSTGLLRGISQENVSTQFKIKLICKATVARFALCFRISYMTTDGRIQEEKFLSDTFLVQSNTTLVAKGPQVDGILPTKGRSGDEVWIRGTNFSTKGMVVTFGGVPATIREASSSLIVTSAPNLSSPRSQTVDVQVYNITNGKKKMSSQQNFRFSYI